MSEAFDPYYKWLGISPQEQPPNHYRLLTINLFESDAQVIESAADRQMVYLRTFQTGQHVRQAQKLLNEIAQARVCLLNPPKKAEYDAGLRRQLVAPNPAAPVAVASPPRPVPQARRLEGEPSGVVPELSKPIVLVDSSTSPSRLSRARPPFWRQPAVLSVAGAAVLLIGVLAVWFARNGKPTTVAEGAPAGSQAIDTLPASRSSSLSPPRETPSPSVVETPPRPAPNPQPSSEPIPPQVVATAPSTSSLQPPATESADAAVPPSAAAAEPGVRIDLLKQIDSKHIVQGNMGRTGQNLSILTSAHNQMFVAQIPYRPGDREYALEIVAELVNQSGPLNLGLKAGEKSFLLSLDYGGRTGLSNVDGRQYFTPQNVAATTTLTGASSLRIGQKLEALWGNRWWTAEILELRPDGSVKIHYENYGDNYDEVLPREKLRLPGAAANARIFAKGARPTIRINVRQRGLEVLADGRPLLNWKEYNRLSPNQSWLRPDREALTIGWNLGTFFIHKLDVIQLSGRFSTGAPAANTVAEASSAVPPDPPATLANLTQRRPVPATEELQAAEKEVREVFRQEFEKAGKPDAKVELARTLANQSDQTRAKPTEHFTMLKLAVDMAAEAGEAELALAALEKLAETYEIDAAEASLPVLTELARSTKTNEARTRTVEAALEYADAAAEEDHFETATQLAMLAMSTASKVRDTELRKTVKEHQDEIKLLQKHWQTAQAALETLKQDPDDPAANLARGKYFCFVKQDWPQGLPLLAKSADAGLKAAAQRELAAEKKPQDKSDLADAWLALAKAAPAADRGILEARAESWYEDALDEVTGLAKTHVERRLNELRQSASSTPKRTATARGRKPQGPQPGMIGRVAVDNTDAGIIVFYQPDKQLQDQKLRDALNTQGLKPQQVRVDLGGIIQLPAQLRVALYQSCAGTNDATCRLFIDNVESATIGSGQSQTSYRTINGGVHSIIWTLTGSASLGICNLRLSYTNPTTGASEQIPIFYLPQSLAALRQLPAKAEIDLSSN
jgi:hypothetical protein